MSKSQEPLHDHHPPLKNLRKLPRIRQTLLAGSHHSTRFLRYFETIFANRCTMQIRQTDCCNHVQSQVQRRFATYYRLTEQSKSSEIKNFSGYQESLHDHHPSSKNLRKLPRIQRVQGLLAGSHLSTRIRRYFETIFANRCTMQTQQTDCCRWTITSSEAFRNVLSLN